MIVTNNEFNFSKNIIKTRRNADLELKIKIILNEKKKTMKWQTFELNVSR